MVQMTKHKNVRAWLGIFEAAVESAHDAVLITNADFTNDGPRIIYVNDAWCRMTGYSQVEVLGQSPKILQGPETDWSVIDRLRDDLKNDRSFEGKCPNYRKDRSSFIMEWSISPIRDESHVITHYVALQRDVTEREKMLAMLKEQALYDGLTGALNRAETERSLVREWERAARYETHLSLVLFDLDNFKNVNDTFGHPTGDEVLQKIGNSISRRLRSSDYFGRWGGEEFAIILPQTSAENAARSAEDCRRLIEDLSFPHGLNITASFGVSDQSGHPDERHLIECADKALYQSKGDGRNRVTTLLTNH